MISQADLVRLNRVPLGHPRTHVALRLGPRVATYTVISSVVVSGVVGQRTVDEDFLTQVFP